jgi:hypothetical protein
MQKVITSLKQNVCLIGVLLGVTCWIIDGLIDFLFFSQESLIENLFYPEPVEIWMRLFNFIILVAFGLVVHLVEKNKL